VTLRRRRDRLEGDVAYRRLRRAVRLAKSRLSNAQSHLARHDADAFYAEIARALLQYVGDKHKHLRLRMTNPPDRSPVCGERSAGGSSATLL